MYIPMEPRWSKSARAAVNLEWPRWARFLMHPYREQFSPALDLPACSESPRLYLMATTPRCGSHFLGHAISSAPYFGFPLEYLNRRNLEMWERRFRERDLAKLFERLLEVRSGPTGWFGIKAHWNQYAEFGELSLFERYGGFQRAIWLYRRDLVAQSVSRVVAEQTGQWIGSAPQRGTRSFDYKAIVRNATMIAGQNREWQRFFGETFEAPVRKVAFEDLITDQEAALSELVRFLDPEAPAELRLSARTSRQSDDVSKAWRERFRSKVAHEHRWILEPQTW